MRITKLGKSKNALQNLESQFAEYLNGRRKKFDLAQLYIHKDLRELSGTNFQKDVWVAVSRIPYGSTLSYSELAKRVGKPKAVRAVASAVAQNQLCIVIPCHRVLPKSQSKTKIEVGNYSLGKDIKRKLLEHEGAL